MHHNKRDKDQSLCLNIKQFMNYEDASGHEFSKADSFGVQSAFLK